MTPAANGGLTSRYFRNNGILPGSLWGKVNQAVDHELQLITATFVSSYRIDSVELADLINVVNDSHNHVFTLNKHGAKLYE